MLSDWRDDRGDGSVLLPVGLWRKPNALSLTHLEVVPSPVAQIPPLRPVSYLIKVLYSRIFRLMRSWLVKAAFLKKKRTKDEGASRRKPPSPTVRIPLINSYANVRILGGR